VALYGTLCQDPESAIELMVNLPMTTNQTSYIEKSFLYLLYNLGSNIRDTTRVGQWKRDFDFTGFDKCITAIKTLRIINDHTEGLSKGRPTPFAHCADNDLAVGMFVDYLSKSPVWKESVVFILEDDAQDGPIMWMHIEAPPISQAGM